MSQSVITSIFQENNQRLRCDFFQDPLIKYLWGNNFIKKQPEILISHLRRIRSQSVNGEEKYERFIKDMKDNEIRYNCSLLPPESRNEENTKVFTEMEAFKDLVQNGKYNKKNSKAIQNNIKSFKLGVLNAKIQLKLWKFIEAL